MRSKKPRLPALVGSAFATAFLAVNIAGTANAEAPVLAILAAGGTVTTTPAPMPHQGTLFITADADPEPALVQAPKEQPKAPVPAAAPEQPAVPAPTQAAPSAAPSVSPTLISDILGGAGAGGSGSGGAVNPASTTQGALSASQQSAPSTGASTVGGGEAAVRATSDVGDLLGKSLNALGVEIHHRSPIISDPVIRGYHLGQYVTQADGAYWFPARMDLDTIVSKIDSSQIENVIIIKGPYSVRYGPGFSFIDVETLSTPRYECGQQFHGQSGLTYKSNGQQWFGLQSVWGGDENSGFRATYGIGTGTDYWDGAGVRQPSGFNTQNYNLDYGFDLGRYAKIELKAMHLEQNNVKIPGAFFDINYLSTDAYTARFFYDDKQNGKAGVDTWFNYTRLTGDNFLPSKREQFPEINGPNAALGANNSFNGADFATTDARMASWGYRAYVTVGSADTPQFTVGSDLRYLNGKQDEFDYTPFGGTLPAGRNFPVPASYVQDPGVFADLSLPVIDNRLKIQSGVRLDWVRTAISNLNPARATGTGVQGATFLPTATGSYAPLFAGTAFSGQQLQNDYSLFSAFITPEWKVNDNITVVGGFGYAQRPPTLTELYALQPFLGVIQNGLNYVVGNPLLSPETLRQVDLGVKFNYDGVRLGVNGYYSWVHNYITLTTQSLGNFGVIGGRRVDFGYQYLNTQEATLVGSEAYVEWDARRWLTVFGTLAYVSGRDNTVNGRPFFNPATGTTVAGPNQEALPNIPPMDVHVGLRFRDPNQDRRWGVEITSRMVATQDQVATTLEEQITGGFTLFDIRSYWRPNNNMLFSAGIENLFNRQYREWADLRPSAGYTVFQPGFNAYVGLRLTY